MEKSTLQKVPNEGLRRKFTLALAIRQRQAVKGEFKGKTGQYLHCSNCQARQGKRGKGHTVQ